MLAAVQPAALADAISRCVLLAQDGGAGGANPLLSFAPLVLIMVLAYFLFVVPQQQKQKRFQQMIDGLKSNDRVVTTGGLHGVVTKVQRDERGGYVTLRVDESSGAKIRVALWAIDSVTDQDDEPKQKPSDAAAAASKS